MNNVLRKFIDELAYANSRERDIIFRAMYHYIYRGIEVSTVMLEPIDVELFVRNYLDL
jgi:hypothetical protein